jgi:hypothetical protein
MNLTRPNTIMMAGKQSFKYAELPIMKYRVFDSESRQFANVPIQPPSFVQWPPEEDEPYEILDEVEHQEPDNSDAPDQQPAAEEDKEAEAEPEQEADADADAAQPPEEKIGTQPEHDPEHEQAEQKPEETEVLNDTDAPKGQFSPMHCTCI